VAATKAVGGVVGRGWSDEEVRDPMKFMNGDDSLESIVSKLEASGKRIPLPNKEMFVEAITNANWSWDGFAVTLEDRNVDKEKIAIMIGLYILKLFINSPNDGYCDPAMAAYIETSGFHFPKCKRDKGPYLHNWALGIHYDYKEGKPSVLSIANALFMLEMYNRQLAGLGDWPSLRPRCPAPPCGLAGRSVLSYLTSLAIVWIRVIKSN
jgi:hypothetical protein